ncbi:hypothetical protein H6F94_01105 [Leptolyngbya sp. FACHB-261]|nr:hypothetical protein [Leptolyngbya sp. FACHB-261]
MDFGVCKAVPRSVAFLLIAQYRANLGQVEVRLQAEQDSVQALDQAKDQVEQLVANTQADLNSANRKLVIGQLQGIINRLEKVSSDATSYLEAQQLLPSVKNKLNQFQPQQ